MKTKETKKLHVAMNNKGYLMVAFSMSEINKVMGRDFIAIHEKTPKLLEDFFKKNTEKVNYFYKGFAHWILCKIYNKKAQENAFGKLKRELHSFSQKLYRVIKRLAEKIARNIGKKIGKNTKLSHNIARVFFKFQS